MKWRDSNQALAFAWWNAEFTSKIEPNSPVIKYGEVIGISTAIIKPGDYVHIHNVVNARGRGDLEGDER